MDHSKILGRIRVDRLKISAFHGVFPQERLIGNEFVVSVEILYPISNAAVNDDINGTVNYADVVEIIRDEMSRPSQLLENVAWRIARSLRANWPDIVEGTVTVAKPTPPIPSTQLDSVSVIVNI